MPDVTINPDSQLVILHTRIKGVESHSELVRDEKEGRRHETERNVTRTVLDTREYKEAKRLESLARSLVRAKALHTPIGNLTDSKRVGTLRERFEELRAEINSYNARARHHALYADLLVLPIAAALGPEACRALCDEVTAALSAVTAMLRSGDVAGVRSWRLRNKNLDALMPELIAGALRTSLEVIGEAQRTLTAAIKDGQEPEEAGAALDLSQLDVAASLILPALPQPEREVA